MAVGVRAAGFQRPGLSGIVSIATGSKPVECGESSCIDFDGRGSAAGHPDPLSSPYIALVSPGKNPSCIHYNS